MRRLAAGDLPPHVRAVDYGIRGTHLAYDLLDGWDALVLVDALPDRGEPGALRVLDVGPDDVGSEGPASWTPTTWTRAPSWPASVRSAAGSPAPWWSAARWPT